jgi:hypothetical protein
MWCNEISKQSKEYTPGQIKSRAKLSWGVPILCAEEPAFAKYWEKVIQAFPTYEEQLDDLMPRTPVTSIMTTKQMARLLTDMERVSCMKYKLTSPSMYGLEPGRY